MASNKLDFQTQVASMKKLRGMLEKAYKYSVAANHEYILIGGECSISGVEMNLRVSAAHLDRMIKDCEGRVKFEQQKKEKANGKGVVARRG